MTPLLQPNRKLPDSSAGFHDCSLFNKQQRKISVGYFLCVNFDYEVTPKCFPLVVELVEDFFSSVVFTNMVPP